MTSTTSEEPRPHGIFSLTRMIYSVCGAVILYIILQHGSRFLLAAQKFPFLLTRMDVWFYASDLSFGLAMLVVILAYHPRSELFRWSSASVTPPAVTGTLWSIVVGATYGAAAFVVASPVFWWLGDRHLGSIRLSIGGALSPLRVAEPIFLIIVLAVCSEVVCRGVVFRTLANYATTPAAILGSALVFASIYPVLSFAVAMILGSVCALLYYRTRNLLAPIVANAVFTTGGGALTLYRSLMHGDKYFIVGALTLYRSLTHG